MQNKDITSKNIVEEISKQVKEFDSEPIYLFSYQKYYAHFEVYINDFLAFKNFKNSSSSSGFEINQYLLPKNNKITYRMFPLGEIKGDDEDYKTLNDESYLSFKLMSYDKKHIANKDIIYSDYKTPTILNQVNKNNNEEKFIGAGKKFYEDSFEIKVNLPFNNNFLYQNAKDLRQLEKTQLEKKVLDFYNKIHKVYKTKDLDNIAKLSFDSFKNEMITNYKTKEEISEIWQELIGIYEDSTFEMQPIKEYKLSYFANGRLVALINKNSDYNFKSTSALWAKVNIDGGTRPFFIDTYLYIPEGETEFKVY